MEEDKVNGSVEETTEATVPPTEVPVDDQPVQTTENISTEPIQTVEETVSVEPKIEEKSTPVETQISEEKVEETVPAPQAPVEIVAETTTEQVPQPVAPVETPAPIVVDTPPVETPKEVVQAAPVVEQKLESLVQPTESVEPQKSESLVQPIAETTTSQPTATNSTIVVRTKTSNDRSLPPVNNQSVDIGEGIHRRTGNTDALIIRRFEDIQTAYHSFKFVSCFSFFCLKH